MAISGIGNSGFAVQQSYSAARGAEKGDNGAQKPGAQDGAVSQSGQSSQAAKPDAEAQKIQQQVQQLKAAEEKVKAHEAAHKAAGGQYASSASYTYRPGPDGRSYIVAGEVQIDMSPGRTPQETIAKMQVVQRAAMAPGDPSGQDRAVAAQAAAIAAQAQQEQLKQDNGEQLAGSPESGGAGAAKKSTPPAAGVTGSASAEGTAAAVPGQATADSAKAEEAVASEAKSRQEVETRQLGAYKASTTPGDIFGAQKMSVYA